MLDAALARRRLDRSRTSPPPLLCALFPVVNCTLLHGLRIWGAKTPRRASCALSGRRRQAAVSRPHARQRRQRVTRERRFRAKHARGFSTAALRPAPAPRFWPDQPSVSRRRRDYDRHFAFCRRSAHYRPDARQHWFESSSRAWATSTSAQRRGVRGCRSLQLVVQDCVAVGC